MGTGQSQNKSLKMDNASVKEKLEKQIKEMEEKKAAAEKAVKEAEAAAGKKNDTKPVAISA
jgi:nuclear polyadenylated RNA-binding protein NAB2